MISYIIPYVPGRDDQFLDTLKSLESQTDQDFEAIVIVRDGEELGDDIHKAVIHLQIEDKFHVYYKHITGQCPATAQNYGVSICRGDIIVLTSPEVTNAPTNVAEIKKLPPRTFWLGWIVEEYRGNMPYSRDASTLKLIKGLTKEKTGHVVARNVPGDWGGWRYFIGALWKEDFIAAGGIDEEFMHGIAWEDREFADRLTAMGYTIELNENIVGVHLWHPRGYQDDNYDLRMINRRLYERKCQEHKLLHRG